MGRHWKSIESRLRVALGQLSVEFTRAPGHARELVRQKLASGADLIVAVGGDGTFSEATDGFFEGDRPIRESAALGLVPAGTGGDFRRTAGISSNLEDAIRQLRDAGPRAIDVGRLRYTHKHGGTAQCHFLNIASFGIGGLVDEIVNRQTKLLGGKISFTLGTARALFSYRNQRVRIRLDGGEPNEVSILNVAVANGRFFGGGMQIAPRAQLDDGLFDVVQLGNLGLWDFVLHGQKLRRGEHLDMKQVRFAQARQVEAQPAIGERVLLDVDGEPLGQLPATFEIVPKALLLKC